MTAPAQKFFDDPRRRNLAIMAAIAAVAVVLAILSLARQADESAPRETHEPFFSDLASKAHAFAHIRIRSKTDVIDVAFEPERGWVVASHDDYPASFEQIRQTFIGLAELTTIEKKTARPDWLGYVDLVAPEQGGNGKEFTLSDDKGAVIASLIAGKTTDIGDPGGAIGLYVRRPGDSQSWLVRSVFEPKSDAGDWLDKQVMTIDRARIAETDVDPLSGPSYVVRRAKPMDADFALVDLPKGRTLSYDSAPDGVAASVVDFSFDDVKPARNFDFSDAAHTARVTTKTFDGLTVVVMLVQQGSDYWATVSAEGANPDAQKEARAINAHASGWAYKLPAFKGQQFTATIESMLKPAGGTAAAQAH
jgi:hypothetical protein